MAYKYKSATQKVIDRRKRFEAKHPELVKACRAKKQHAYRLKRVYRMAYADYQRLYAIQGGRCAICRTPKDKLCVDHCHETQRVRGLLCSHCNHAVGFIREDPLAARALVEYIEKRCIPAKRLGPI